MRPALRAEAAAALCRARRKRNRKGEKNGKGLRHFSMKVCEKVQRKGTTSYNEVADELVAEFSAADSHILPSESVSAPGRPPPAGAEEAPEPLGGAFPDPPVPPCCCIPAASARSRGPCGGRPGRGGSMWPQVCPGSLHVVLGRLETPCLCQAYDQKNIRRRVYDALNVLMAMNIISKEKKEIKWIGLPTNSAQECQGLEVAGRRPGAPSGPWGAGGDLGWAHAASWPVGALKNVVSTPRGGAAGRRRHGPETEESPRAWQQLPRLGPCTPSGSGLMSLVTECCLGF